MPLDVPCMKRRKWTLRLRSTSGDDEWLVIFVPRDGEGEIRASVGKTSWLLMPEDVSKLRRYWLEAQDRALRDRGHW